MFGTLSSISLNRVSTNFVLIIWSFTSDCIREMKCTAQILIMNLSFQLSSSVFLSTNSSSHAPLKTLLLRATHALAVSSLIVKTGSVSIWTRVYSIFYWNVSQLTKLAILGMKLRTANLIRHVLSLARLMIAGISFSIKRVSPMFLKRGSRFSTKETMTSVVLFLRRIDTSGIRY